MIKKMLKTFMLSVIIGTGILTAGTQVYASEGEDMIYKAGQAETYEITEWSQEEKDEYIRLINNLHINVNRENPDLQLSENVTWSDELEYVTKVKLEYQYENYIKNNMYSPHVYHQRPEPYETLKPLMNGYFLDGEGYYIKGKEPPYFYLENETHYKSSAEYSSLPIYDIIVGYLTEKDNPQKNVGHATALLGAEKIGSAYNLYKTENGRMKSGIHEIVSYKGTSFRRSCNNDSDLIAYAMDNLYLNQEKVEKLLKDPVEVPETEKKHGWRKENGKWYYIDENGNYLKNGWKWIGNSCYYFYGDGSIAVNTWVGDSYVNGSGAWVEGSWQSSAKGWWYNYPQGGYPENKFENIKGQTYYFGNNGYMQTGWISTGGVWYYAEGSGAIVKNTWKWIGNGCYYFYEDGSMAVNTWVGNSYVNGSGAWVEGSWQSSAKGWWYNYPQGGYPENKFENIKGQTYYFGNNGYMQTGWISTGGVWYYAEGSGAIVKNTWKWIGNGCYYFYGDGSMAVNTWVGGSYVNGSGAWVA